MFVTDVSTDYLLRFFLDIDFKDSFYSFKTFIVFSN